MTLNFPNRSRSYDAGRRCVCFWGYDGAFEIPFFVHQDALARINTEPKWDEAVSLSTFDKFRDRILEVAGNVYRGRRKDAYTLMASDF